MSSPYIMHLRNLKMSERAKQTEGKAIRAPVTNPMETHLIHHNCSLLIDIVGPKYETEISKIMSDFNIFVLSLGTMTVPVIDRLTGCDKQMVALYELPYGDSVDMPKFDADLRNAINEKFAIPVLDVLDEHVLWTEEKKISELYRDKPDAETPPIAILNRANVQLASRDVREKKRAYKFIERIDVLRAYVLKIYWNDGTAQESDFSELAASIKGRINYESFGDISQFNRVFIEMSDELLWLNGFNIDYVTWSS